MSVAEGRCLCGEVRFAVQSAPRRVTICHCKFCQRATGSAYLVEPIFGLGDFAVTHGQPHVYEHRSEGSGKLVCIHFCATCGTKLYLTFERFAEVVGVYAGTFDDPNWFERTPENSKQIFMSVAQHGSVFLPDINTFEEHSTTSDGAPIAPMIFSEPKIIGP